MHHFISILHIIHHCFFIFILIICNIPDLLDWINSPCTIKCISYHMSKVALSFLTVNNSVQLNIDMEYGDICCLLASVIQMPVKLNCHRIDFLLHFNEHNITIVKEAGFCSFRKCESLVMHGFTTLLPLLNTAMYCTVLYHWNVNINQ